MFVCAVLLPGGALSVGVCVWTCVHVLFCVSVCTCVVIALAVCVCVCAERELRFTGARTASHE